MIWRPFTQEAITAAPLMVQRAEGAYVYDEKGRGYLDMFASWWTNIHGHAHPQIAAAIGQQAAQLGHIQLGDLMHQPALDLTQKLSAFLPTSLSKLFFSDNGSTSVEIALKMAYQFWSNQGITSRTLYMSLEGGYHGDTYGAMSVGVSSGFYATFQPFLFKTYTVPAPHTWQEDLDIEEKEREALEACDKWLHAHGRNTVALILEPLIQGAGGMRFLSPTFLNQLIEKVRAYDILVIFDEVMTGFGRTGKMFALEHLDHLPDFICLSKGITGGELPLAATVTTETVFQEFLAPTFEKAFIHGHSYTGNSIACAAGVASLNLFQSESTLEKIHKIEAHHQERCRRLNRLGKASKIRVLGDIAAFEWSAQQNYGSQLGERLKLELREKGLLVRPLGNTFYFLPPYCISEEDLSRAYDCLETALAER